MAHFAPDGKLILNKQEWDRAMADMKPSGLVCLCGEPMMNMGPYVAMLYGRPPGTVCKNCDLKNKYRPQKEGT